MSAAATESTVATEAVRAAGEACRSLFVQVRALEGDRFAVAFLSGMLMSSLNGLRALHGDSRAKEMVDELVRAAFDEYPERSH